MLPLHHEATGVSRADYISETARLSTAKRGHGVGARRAISSRNRTGLGGSSGLTVIDIEGYEIVLLDPGLWRSRACREELLQALDEGRPSPQAWLWIKRKKPLGSGSGANG